MASGREEAEEPDDEPDGEQRSAARVFAFTSDEESSDDEDPDGPVRDPDWSGDEQGSAARAFVLPSDEEESDESEESDEEFERRDPDHAPQEETKVACLKRKLVEVQCSIDDISTSMKDKTYKDVCDALMKANDEVNDAVREIKAECLADQAEACPFSVHHHMTGEFGILDTDVVRCVLKRGKDMNQEWWDDLMTAYGHIITEDMEFMCPYVAMTRLRDFAMLLDFRAQKSLSEKGFGAGCPLCQFCASGEEPRRSCLEGFTWDLMVHAPQLVVNVLNCRNHCRPRRRRRAPDCACWIRWAARDAATEEHWADAAFLAAVGPRDEKRHWCS